LVGVVIAMDAVFAAKILKWAFAEVCKPGWTTAQILDAADAPEATRLKSFLAYASIFLIAKSLFLCGILAGEVFSIYLGKYK
jgi:hypothetical protein